jgi:hypothetical protein
LQKGKRPLKGSLLTADHDRKRGLLGADLAAGASRMAAPFAAPASEIRSASIGETVDMSR